MKFTKHGNKPYQCDVCMKKFLQPCHLANHKRTHIGVTHDGAQSHDCNLCSKSFSTSRKLFLHVRNLHSEDKPFQCDSCQKRFVQLSWLVRHRKTHFGHKPYECNICGRRFLELYNLERHRRTHTGVKPYECDVCKKKFSESGNLVKHKLLHTGERRFECDICKKRFFKFYNMKKHKRTHAKDRPFQCSVCKIRFSRLDALKRHFRTDSGKSHECGVCKKMFCNSNRLIRHKRTHVEDKPAECDVSRKRMLRRDQTEIFHSEGQPNECDICKKVFKEKNDLVNHRKTHKDVISEPRLNCDVDKKKDSQSNGVRAHTGHEALEDDGSDNTLTEREATVAYLSNFVQTNKPYSEEMPQDPECNVEKKTYSRSCGLIKRGKRKTKGKVLECDACHKRYSRIDFLDKHKSMCTEGQPHKCDICKKKFSNSIKLHRHKVNLHVKEKSFECDVCEKRFIQLSKLVQHKRTHSDDRPHECNICGKRFLELYNFKRHKRTHSGEQPYECDVCKKKFSDSGNLLKHKLLHTGDRRFECDICKKRFFKFYNMTQHKRTHFKDRPFECDICKKRFLRSKGLKIHKMMHFANDHFECDICHKMFSNSERLMRHKSEHSEHIPAECDVGKKILRINPMKRFEVLDSDDQLYECDICMKRFTESSDLVNHEKTHADVTSNEFLNSDVDRKRYSQSNGKRTHCRDTCKPNESDTADNATSERVELELSDCNIGKERFSQLNGKRTLSVVSNDSSFDCDVGEKSSESNGLKNRKRIRTGHKRYDCIVCKKRYSRSDHYERHIRMHAVEKSVANDCHVSDKGLIASPKDANKSQSGVVGKEPSVYNKEFTKLVANKCHVSTCKCDISDNVFTERVDWLREPEQSECSNGKGRYSQLKGKTAHTGVSIDRDFDCDACEKRSESNGMANCKRTRVGHKSYQCKFCKKRYSRSDHFERHIRTHAGEESVANECHVSDKGLIAAPSRLVDANKSQSGEVGKEPSIYIKEFSKSVANEYHVSSCKCDISDNVFTERVDSLREPEHPECSNGKGIYSQLNGERPHTGVSNDRGFDCDAGEKSSGSNGMANRKRTRVGHKSYQCKFCKKRYSRSDHFERHTRAHAGEESVANECYVSDKGLIAAPSSLVDANKSQSGEVGEEPSIYVKEFSKSVAYECPVSTCKCDISDNVFTEPVDSNDSGFHCDAGEKSSESNGMANRKRTRIGHKSYQCKFCKKRYSRSDHFERHTRIHAGEEPVANECHVSDNELIAEPKDANKSQSGEVGKEPSIYIKEFSESVANECHVSDKRLVTAPNSLVEPNNSHTEEIPCGPSVYNKKYSIVENSGDKTIKSEVSDNTFAETADTMAEPKLLECSIGREGFLQVKDKRAHSYVSNGRQFDCDVGEKRSEKSVAIDCQVSRNGLIAAPHSVVEPNKSQTEEVAKELSVYNKKFSTSIANECHVSDKGLIAVPSSSVEPQNSQTEEIPYETSVYNKEFSIVEHSRDKPIKRDTSDNALTERVCRLREPDHFKRHTKTHAGEESVANESHVAGKNGELLYSQQVSYYKICGETAINLVGENFCDCSFCKELERTGQTTGIGFVCSLCNVVFDIHRELFEHMVTHSSELDG